MNQTCITFWDETKCTRVLSSGPVHSSCMLLPLQDTQICRSKQLSNEPLSCRRQRAAGKSDHWCHLFSLSDPLSFRDTKAHISWKRWDAAIAAMIWCTEMYISHPHNAGQYQSQKTDKPSNKDSISNVWSQTENDKSQKQTATRHPGRHRQNHHIAIHLYMIIQWAKWLISWFRCLHRIMRKTWEEKLESCISGRETKAIFIFICNHRVGTKPINREKCLLFASNPRVPPEPW